MKKILVVLFAMMIVKSGFTQSGSLHTGFSTDGYDTPDLSAGNFGDESISELLIQSDGKRLAVFEMGFSKVMIARYNPDGTPDLAYGDDGFSQSSGDIGFPRLSAAIQTDNKVVIAGSDNGAILWDYVIVRYKTDGSLDETFGDNGKVSYDFGFDDEARKVLIQPDGKILVGGVTTVNNQEYMAFLRLNPDGTPDATFGFGGRYVNVTYEGSDLIDMALLPDLKIAVIGSAYAFGDVLLARFNSNGTPDNSFSTDGFVEHDIGSGFNDVATSLAIQPDGKWVVAGRYYNGVNYDFLVMRFLTTGSFDTGFHGDGKQNTHIGNTEIAYDVAIQADGKIVVGGYSNSNAVYFALARYTSTGDLDGGFGLQGTELTSFANLGYDNGATISNLRILPDGRILAAGTASKESNFFVQDIVMASYTSAGQLQERFTYFMEDYRYTIFWDVVVQADGKPVVVGYAWNGLDMDFLVVRYNTDGSFDNTFGTGGVQKIDFGGNQLSPSSSEYALAVLIQPDGRILVGGDFHGANESLMAIARLNSDGTPDLSFNGNGKVTIDLPGIFDEADDIALQPDGKILVGGNSLDNNFDYALARLLPDGSLDPSFDTDGIVISDWAYQDMIFGLAVQPDGKILATGNTSATTGHLDFNLARYNADGSLDNSFGTNGRQTADFFDRTEFANDVVLQPGGKIIISGSIINVQNLSYDFGAARFNGDGSPDLAFGVNGKVISSFGGDDRTFKLIMESSGKFFMSGYYTEESDIPFDPDTEKDVIIARYNPDGSFNECFADRGKVVSDLGGKELIYGGAYHEGKYYVSGNSEIYNSFTDIHNYDGLIAVYNTTGTAVSLSCPPGGIVNAVADAGQCLAIINDPVLDPLLCPEDATGTINYVISRNNVVIESGTGTVKGKQFMKGNTNVTYSVAGQPALTCSFTITVTDEEAPQLTCPATANIDIGAYPGCFTPMPDLRNLVQVTDNCDQLQDIIINQLPPPGEIVSGLGNMMVTFTAMDSEGNSSEPCSFLAVKGDFTPPRVEYCPDSITRNVTPGRCDAMVNPSDLGPPIAFDYCSSSIIITNDMPPGNIFPVGNTTITWTYVDGAGNTSYCAQVVTVVDNEPPVITGESASEVILSPANHTMRNVYIGYTATDNCFVTTSLSVTSNEPVNGVGDGDTDPDWIVVDNHNVILRAERAAMGNGRIYTVTITAEDASGNVVTKTVEVRVPHDIRAPRSGQPFVVGSTVNFQGEFWDKQGTTHTSQWLIDDGPLVSGIVTEPTANQNGKVTGSKKFNEPGVYKLQMNVTDQDGVTHYSNSNGDLDAIIVIYDPNGGYTYGGGWFQSMAGALTGTQSTGKASYGFAVNYRNAAKPKGETQFQFKVGNFEFNALNYNYLVISGAKAQFRGTGKIIGGQSGINFIMTVKDGDLDGTGQDKIRLKIFRNNGQVIYDNQPGASDAADPVQVVAENSEIFVQGQPLVSRQSSTLIENENVLSLQAFPNPASEQFNFSATSASSEKITYRLTDQAGRIIHSGNMLTGEIITFGKFLKPGLYLLTAVQGKERQQLKLIML